MVSMPCSPMAMLVYFDAYSLWAVLTAMAVGFCLGLGVHILTKDEEGLPTLDLGTSFAFGPAILSLAGFIMGVLWIDTLASEVVGIVSLTSKLLSLPPSLVGLTLLAVGSSLGDAFGNPSMARRGHASTALTACFAGPLFNMLISMAAGFGSFFAREGVTRTQVQFTPDIALGVGCLVIYNIVVAAVGILNKSRIPEKFYLFARAWYAMYIIIACLLGITGLV
ncbi:hypothetical protein DUNSADRAFT_792 [Dunaliella salina]|uniref:Sodium/calcium exchanger membrane region domain-containing protein n=1 Tax=Dunaliella salina TaxID=3046 RepID=A0ABQ7FYB5_DUNSA|nr:hypothetical protein DUNSADRAFT_792 [Dunaliella salina]|eukprot:KAF5827360.1 hypothetical protein DUNSADRAFT_792 [Dunaliella salina]